jgi:signal transduction histidine kinase
MSYHQQVTLHVEVSTAYLDSLYFVIDELRQAAERHSNVERVEVELGPVTRPEDDG